MANDFTNMTPEATWNHFMSPHNPPEWTLQYVLDYVDQCDDLSPGERRTAKAKIREHYKDWVKCPSNYPHKYAERVVVAAESYINATTNDDLHLQELEKAIQNYRDALNKNP